MGLCSSGFAVRVVYVLEGLPKEVIEPMVRTRLREIK
jgi:hypothetical protein